MSDVFYIGCVRRVSENPETHYRHAIVEPLVQSSADQTSWIGSIKNPVAEFPARGLVFWHDAPRNLVVGDYRQFLLEPHPNFNGEPDREAFTIMDATVPIEILDLRDFGTERDIRILLTTNGILLNHGPLVDSCVLWIHDEKWIGPLELTKRNDGNLWTVATSQRLDQIPCMNISLESIQKVDVNGTRYLLKPVQGKLGHHIGLVNWEKDEVLAKRVFGRLLKRDRTTAEALGITKDVFKKYVEIIKNAGYTDIQFAEAMAFEERIQELSHVISKNEELLDEAAKVCFAIGPVKEKIEKEAEEEYRKLLVANESRLKNDLANIQEDLDKANADLTKKQELLKSIQKRISTAEQELTNRVEGFENELDERLGVIAQKPERLFAEMACTRAMSLASRCTPLARSREKYRTQEVELPEAPKIEEPSELVAAFSRRLLDIGISPLVGHTLHFALSAGVVPVVIGPDAYDVIRSYADCISSGVLHWIPVGGSLFEPSDLLGRLDPSSNSLVPHPGGLLDLLLDDSDSVHLVVLDGFNRAASDGYLLPLLQSLADSWEGRNQRTIPLVPSEMSLKEGSNGTSNRIAWNRNVLLILKPSIGTSVLPVPEDLWTKCVVIDTDSPVDEVESPGAAATQVTKEVWTTWSDRVISQSKPLERLSRHPKSRTPLPRAIRRINERLHGAGLTLGLTPDRAAEQALKIGLIPFLVSSGEPLDEWSQVLGLELDERDRRVEDMIRRLGE